MYASRDKTTFGAECTTKSVLPIRLMLLGLQCSRALGVNQCIVRSKGKLIGNLCQDIIINIYSVFKKLLYIVLHLIKSCTEIV